MTKYQQDQQVTRLEAGMGGRVCDFTLHAIKSATSPINQLQVKRLTSNAMLPTRGSEQAIGADLYADLLGDQPETLLASLPPQLYVPNVRIAPGERKVIPTGIAVQFPSGFYARVAPRSGLAAKQGVDVLAGVIDQDYTGEIKVIMLNTGDDLVTVRHGDRIAQLILERAEIMPIVEVTELSDSDRGAAGFGSTGR